MNAQKNPDSVIAELNKIKGVGVWIAELTMLYA
jgi:3-methyladenine DNA glycosylase/8-oxoguanine DNA glycosylase